MKQEKFKIFLEKMQVEKDPVSVLSNNIALYVYQLATEQDTESTKDDLFYYAERANETGRFFIRVCSLLYNGFNRSKITEAKKAFHDVKQKLNCEDYALRYFLIIRSNDNWTIGNEKNSKPIGCIPEMLFRFCYGFKKRDREFSNYGFSFIPPEPKDSFFDLNGVLNSDLEELVKRTSRFFYDIAWNNTNDETKIFLSRFCEIPENLQPIIKNVSNILFQLFYSEQEKKCFEMWNTNSFRERINARIELEKIIKYQRKFDWKINGENIKYPGIYCYKRLINKGFTTCN